MSSIEQGSIDPKQPPFIIECPYISPVCQLGEEVRGRGLVIPAWFPSSRKNKAKNGDQARFSFARIAFRKSFLGKDLN